MHLKTISDVVRAFGGPRALAKWAGISPSAVSNWIAKDYIPPAWHYRIFRECSARGYVVEESVFDERVPPSEEGHGGQAACTT